MNELSQSCIVQTSTISALVIHHIYTTAKMVSTYRPERRRREADIYQKPIILQGTQNTPKSESSNIATDKIQDTSVPSLRSYTTQMEIYYSQLEKTQYSTSGSHQTEND